MILKYFLNLFKTSKKTEPLVADIDESQLLESSPESSTSQNEKSCEKNVSKDAANQEQLITGASQSQNTKEITTTPLSTERHTVEESSDNQEIVKLKQKIKKLTDECEEIESERDDIELRSRKKEAEYLHSISELEQKKGRVLKEVNQLKEILKEKDNELNDKEQALDFVQEILRAPEVTDDAKRNEQEKIIQKLYDFILEDIQNHLYVKVKDVPAVVSKKYEQAQLREQLDRWASIERKTWIKKKVSIAFIGEFSAGKTSLVNRILSQDNPDATPLPVSSKATTAIPTYISYAEVKPAYHFLSPDNSIKKMKEEIFKKVSKTVLEQVQGLSSLITYFVMEYKNEHLKHLSILDTPGFSSNDQEDAIRTIDVINECDALFWVFDVNAGTVNRKSIETIRQHLRRPLHVVINKVDTKSEKEVDEVLKLIQEILEKEGIKVNGYHRFSNTAPIENILAPISKLTQQEKEETSLLQSIEDDLGYVLKHLEEKQKSANRSLTEAKAAVSKKQRALKEKLHKIESESERFKSFFTLKSSWFSGNSYKLDEEDGQEMISFLESFGQTSYELKNIGKDIEENAKKIDEKEKDSKDLLALILETKEIINKFKSQTKKLN